MKINKFKWTLLFLMIFGITHITNAQYLTESFESGSIPSGWTMEKDGIDLNWGYQNGGASIGGDKVPMASNDGAFNAILVGNSFDWGYTKLVTAEIDLSAAINPQINFWHAQADHLGTVEELRLYYKTSAASTWVLIEEWTTSIENWQEETILLPNASSTYYIAFEGKVIYSHGVVIDNITVENGPSCVDPTDLNAINIAETQADLTWTEIGVSTNWDIEILNAGATPTGNATHNNVSNPYTVTGLSSTTDYEFYVRADCSEDDVDVSAWVGPYAFSPACAVINAPYTQDFENNGDIPDCWTQGENIDGDWEFSDNSSLGHIGNHGDLGGTTTESEGYFAWVDDSDLGFDNNFEMESPFINLSSVSSPELTFYMISHDEYTSGSAHESAGLKVSVWNGTTWVVEFTEENNTSGWVQKTVDLSSYSGIIKLRFEVYQVGPVSVNYDYFDDLAIDDIEVKSADATNINNKLISNNIKLYPNPSTGIFNVSFELNTNLVNIDIINMQGQVIFSKTNVETNSIQSINMSDASIGMYYLRISSDNNTIVKKLNILK